MSSLNSIFYCKGPRQNSHQAQQQFCLLFLGIVCLGRTVFLTFVCFRYHIKLPSEFQTSSLHPLALEATTRPSSDQFLSSSRALPSESFLLVSHYKHLYQILSSACVNTTAECDLDAYKSGEVSTQIFLLHSNLES